jgi:hypothetical protein
MVPAASRANIDGTVNTDIITVSGAALGTDTVF